MESKISKVIMLPTTEKTNIVRNTYCFSEAHGNPLKYVPKMDNPNNLVERGYEYQFLYFITDEEIKEGDWCLYNKNHNSKNPFWELFRCGKIEREEMHPFSKDKLLLWCVKIVATTNLSLKMGICEDCQQDKDYRHNFIKCTCKLPQSPEDFIEKYCELGGIDEALIKYQEIQETKVFPNGMQERSERTKILRPKVDSHNTIIINPIKDSWTREEVINFILSKNYPYVSPLDYQSEKVCRQKLDEELIKYYT